MSVYACTDLHGCGWAWDKIKEFLKPEDTLYFLGDAIDRGPDGFRIMKELLLDSRVVYLKGNHEDMMVATYLNQHSHYDHPFQVWMYNGGRPTFEAVPFEERKDWARALNELPTIATYINAEGTMIKMTHSGFLPDQEYERLWNRHHFYDMPIENKIIIHGHTPVSYLAEDLSFFDSDIPEKPPCDFWYCKGTKCDIDCGTVFTGRCVLLNLDSFEATVFYGGEEDA